MENNISPIEAEFNKVWGSRFRNDNFVIKILEKGKHNGVLHLKRELLKI
jgi:hypothetical protein